MSSRSRKPRPNAESSTSGKTSRGRRPSAARTSPSTSRRRWGGDQSVARAIQKAIVTGAQAVPPRGGRAAARSRSQDEEADRAHGRQEHDPARDQSRGVAALSEIEGMTNCGAGPGFGPTANVNAPRPDGRRPRSRASRRGTSPAGGARAGRREFRRRSRRARGAGGLLVALRRSVTETIANRGSTASRRSARLRAAAVHVTLATASCAGEPRGRTRRQAAPAPRRGDDATPAARLELMPASACPFRATRATIATTSAARAERRARRSRASSSRRRRRATTSPRSSEPACPRTRARSSRPPCRPSRSAAPRTYVFPDVRLGEELEHRASSVRRLPPDHVTFWITVSSPDPVDCTSRFQPGDGRERVDREPAREGQLDLGRDRVLLFGRHREREDLAFLGHHAAGSPPHARRPSRRARAHRLRR